MPTFGLVCFSLCLGMTPCCLCSSVCPSSHFPVSLFHLPPVRALPSLVYLAWFWTSWRVCWSSGQAAPFFTDPGARRFRWMVTSGLTRAASQEGTDSKQECFGQSSRWQHKQNQKPGPTKNTFEDTMHVIAACQAINSSHKEIRLINSAWSVLNRVL